MKLPWNSEELEERVEELESRVEELSEEKERYRERFEAEKERRSELSRQKQDAEEELNRLKDKIEGRNREDDGGTEDREISWSSLDLDETRKLLRKLGSVDSPEKDLLTVYSPGKVTELDDYRGLRNAATRKQIALLNGQEKVAAFMDTQSLRTLLKSRQFFSQGWELSDSFDVSRLIDFMEREKTFALVSAGETRIFREENGACEEIETLKSRVDRKHSKGGYSQDRFERKRDEQIEEHLEKARRVLEDREDTYLLGEKKMCEQLPGNYIGGFDPNRKLPERFYGFQLADLNPL